MRHASMEQSQPVQCMLCNVTHFLVLSTATPSPDKQALDEGILADNVHLVLAMGIHLLILVKRHCL